MLLLFVSFVFLFSGFIGILLPVTIIIVLVPLCLDISTGGRVVHDS